MPELQGTFSDGIVRTNSTTKIESTFLQHITPKYLKFTNINLMEIKLMKKTTLITFWILILCALTFAQTKNTASDIVTIADFEIKMPVKLIGVGSFRDGGTISVTMEDSLGRQLIFCLDKRLNEVYPNQFKNIYLGIQYPSAFDEQKKGIQLSIAGNEEKLLLKVLKNWKENNVSKEQQVKIAELSKLEGQAYYDAVNKLPKEEYATLNRFSQIFDVINELENRKPINKVIKPTFEINEASVDREKARKLADFFVDDLINNRRNKIRAVIDENFFKNYEAGESDFGEAHLDEQINDLTKYYGKLIRCNYVEDMMRTALIDGVRVGKREVWYDCQTSNQPVGLLIDVLQNKEVLTIKDFRWNYPPSKK